MGQAGFALTRYADDWVIVCRSQAEAKRALASARQVLEGELGLRLNPDKTRIVHIARGFEFLGYKIGRGKRLSHKAGGPSLYAIPTDRSIRRFKDKVRTATNRRNPKSLEGVLGELNPIIRGWGNYYRRAHVRRLYNRLNRWIVLRVWSHQHKRWRNAGWRHLPAQRLYGSSASSTSCSWPRAWRATTARRAMPGESRLRENCTSGSEGRAEVAARKVRRLPRPDTA